MTEADGFAHDQDTATEFAARFAGVADSPAGERVRESLIHRFMTASASPARLVTQYPHLAADVAMEVVGPVLAEGEVAAARFRDAVTSAADALVTGRSATISAAARASERRACVAALRTEAGASGTAGLLAAADWLDSRQTAAARLPGL